MLSPFDSYQVMRGVKTLPARMERHEENARYVAEWLQEQDMVTEVLYPGLETHPQHELAAEQMSGFGGMLSFRIDGGFEEAERFLDALEDIPLAVSLGGVETLIEHPSSMTHAGMSAKEREASGVTHDLLRLSVGIEDPEDLVADLQRGFDALST
ncbi:MAG: PLP-dependent transferase, partial [Candidatus Nanohaloarchaea archaeon]|nr:PLP-dependent transferase [Candidatus Nanohaloarchaea archaeon]